MGLIEAKAYNGSSGPTVSVSFVIYNLFVLLLATPKRNEEIAVYYLIKNCFGYKAHG